MSSAIITSSIWIGDRGVLSLDELAVACGVEAEWIIELVDIGVLLPEGGGRADWRFAAEDLGRARRLWRLVRDFEANAETAAVILDLLDENERLRSRLRRAGLTVD